MEEKRRRREIMALYDKGFTQAEIACKLGVSVKTVSRDWRKLRRYVEHLKWREEKKISQTISAALDKSLNRIPSVMRFQLVGSLMFADKRTKNRAFNALLARDLPVLRSIIAKVFG